MPDFAGDMLHGAREEMTYWNNQNGMVYGFVEATKAVAATSAGMLALGLSAEVDAGSHDQQLHRVGEGFLQLSAGFGVAAVVLAGMTVAVRNQLRQDKKPVEVETKRRFESLDEETDRELVRAVDATYCRWRLVKPYADAPGLIARDSLAIIDKDMRGIGQVIATTYDITYMDLKTIVSSVYQQHEMEAFGRIPAARSWMHIRLAQGLFDGGAEAVARETLADQRFHPDYRSELEAYMHNTGASLNLSVL
jgi:hypothetical protein